MRKRDKQSVICGICEATVLKPTWGQKLREYRWWVNRNQGQSFDRTCPKEIRGVIWGMMNHLYEEHGFHSGDALSSCPCGLRFTNVAHVARHLVEIRDEDLWAHIVACALREHGA